MNQSASLVDEEDLPIFGESDPLLLGVDTDYLDFDDGPLPEDWRDFATSASGLKPGDGSAALADALDAVEADEAQLARLAARRAEAIEHSRLCALVSDELVLFDPRLRDDERTEWAMRAFVSEIATRLRIPQPTAAALIEDSRVLVRELPDTYAALASGSISYRHAQVIIDQSRTLPAETRAEFERTVLPDAGRLPVTRFRQKAARVRERLHPDSVTDRRRAEESKRRIAVDSAADGMAWLSHYLPVGDANAIYDRVTSLARSLQSADEPRSLDQLRSDVARDLLFDAELFDPQLLLQIVPNPEKGAPEQPSPEQPSMAIPAPGRPAPAVYRVDGPTRSARHLPRGIRPTVIVTVPVLTLLGQSEEPGYLSGYGPIDPEMARKIAAGAPSFIRLLTHPETGVALSLGRKRYKVPRDLRIWLQLRDEICRFPGCGASASRSEIDHTVAWEHGGPTDANNLAHLCAASHRLKHATTWQVEQGGNGEMNWTSPTGKKYTTDPAVNLPAAVPSPPAPAEEPAPF